MKPIKPKYADTVKVDWKISKRSRQIISQYAKYTKYEESEIVDKLIIDILEYKSFVNWLNKRRYNTKIQGVIFETLIEGDTDFEKVPENSEF